MILGKFSQAFRKFVIDVLDANDPLEVIVATYENNNYFVRAPDGSKVDITDQVTYQLGAVSRRVNPREGTCNIMVQQTVAPNQLQDPNVDYHDGNVIVESIQLTAQHFSNGDQVLILKTQKPVTYILLGKIGRKLN
jgi:hypothetical protein